MPTKPPEALAKSLDHPCIRSMLLAHARQSPDAIALLAPGRSPLTYAALLAQMDRVAEALHGMGIGRQDRVAAVFPNGPEAAAAYVAIASVATYAPLDPACQAREMGDRLSDLNPGVLILQAGVRTPARDVARALGIRVVELTPLTEAQAGLFELSGPSSASSGQGEFAGPDDDAVALYTSGTTAKSRLVLLTQVSVCLSAHAIADSLQLTASDRCLNVLAPFHAHGLDAGTLASFAAGASIGCTPGFDSGRFLEWVRDLRPTWYSAAPAVHRAALAVAAANRDAIRQSELRFVRSTSSTLPAGLKAELEDAFGVPVIECYGMTEVGPIASERLPLGTRKVGSAGASVGPEVAIMDARGDLLPATETGEIVVRGPTVTRRYENDPDANRTAFTNGWFRTGDQGYLDPEGSLFITGRLKEIIDRGGEKVSPQEVDGVVMEHPAVGNVATFPMPDERLGEEVAAAVVLRPGARATERDLIRYASERLADHKVPRRFIICDKIPTGPTGKVQRTQLAQQLGLAEGRASADGNVDRPASPGTELEAGLITVWEEVLETGGVGLRDNFFDLGGDSLGVARVLARVEGTFGVAIPPAIFHQEPTVAGLSRAVLGELGSKPPPTLVPLQPNGPGRPFFMVAPGTAWALFPLAKHLGEDRPFYGLQSFEAIDSVESRIEIEELAAYYLRHVRRLQYRGPYLIGGVSGGGVVALEMAQQLLAQGQQVGALVMVDTPYGKMFLRPGFLKGSSWRHLPLWLAMNLRVAGVPPLSQMPRPLPRLRKVFLALYDAPRHDRAAETRYADGYRALVYRTIDVHIGAVRRYRPKPYPGKIAYLWAEDARFLTLRDPRLGWDRVARGGVTVYRFRGPHRGMLTEPHVQALASKLKASLTEATEAIAQAESERAGHG